VAAQEVIDIDWIVCIGMHEGLPRNIAAPLAKSQAANAHKEPNQALCRWTDQCECIRSAEKSLACSKSSTVILGHKVTDRYVVHHFTLKCILAGLRHHLWWILTRRLSVAIASTWQ
jgi:hypothetical protein